MNKIFGMLFSIICAIFFFAGQANAADKGWHNRHANDAHTNVSDTLLKNNSQVHQFLPSDIRGEAGTSKTCNSEGRYVDDGRTVSSCMNYRSAATNTSWRIRYVDYATDHSVPVGDVVIAQIFKIKNGNLSLWASFNGHREKTYASADAQKFANANGSDDTEVAQSSQSTDHAEGIPKIDPVDVAKKAFGLIKGW